jgi:hypothetical protein
LLPVLSPSLQSGFCGSLVLLFFGSISSALGLRSAFSKFIIFVKFFKVTVNLFIQCIFDDVQFLFVVVVFLRVGGFKFAAVYGYGFFAEELPLFAEVVEVFKDFF